MTQGEVDLVKARLLALTQPDDLDAQLAQMEQPHRRQWFVLDRLCAKFGGRAYATAIARRMNAEGRLGSADLENLRKQYLQKVIVALTRQVRRKERDRKLEAKLAAGDPF